MDGRCDTFLDISPRRILVIKLSSLGDIVHTLPAVSSLRERFPSAHISWLVKTQWNSILEGNLDINEVVSWDKAWGTLPNLVQRLRAKQYDLVIDFQGLFRSGILARLSGASIRLGFAQAREGATWLYTHRVNLPGDKRSSWRLLAIHAVDRNMALAAYLGADISRPIFHLPALAADRDSISSLLFHKEGQDGAKFLALAPWSRSELKSWPLQRFVQLAEKLMHMRTIRVVLLGGPDDSRAAEQFHFLESQGLINLVGKLSLRQVPELLRHIELLVGNDSSLIHLAAGVGTKVVALFGPTEPQATGPYPVSQHAVCRTALPCSPCGQRTCRNQNYLECLNSISVASLLTTIQTTLMVSGPSTPEPC